MRFKETRSNPLALIPQPHWFSQTFTWVGIAYATVATPEQPLPLDSHEP